MSFRFASTFYVSSFIIVLLIISGCDNKKTYHSLNEALANPDKVEELYLSGHKLKSLPPEIGKLKNLKFITLSDNLLSSMPPEFANLTNLERLLLGENQFTEIPASVYSLKKLKVLNLSHNNISNISEKLWLLDSLENLDLSNNAIIDLNMKSNRLERLKIIRFDNNYISEIPSLLFNSKKLESVYINNNNIRSIPPGISNLKEISSINMGKNRIETLPPEIGSLKRLKMLKLNNNRLTILPQEICSLDSLATLWLSFNYLDSLPEKFSQLKSLDALELMGIRSTGFEKVLNVLQDCKQIQSLNISNNGFEEFPLEILNITQLLSLKMDYNNLKFIPAEIKQLEKLTNLSLQGNSISVIDEYLLKLKNLKEINLDFNPLDPLLMDSLRKMQKSIIINFKPMKTKIATGKTEISSGSQMPLQASGVFRDLSPVGNSFGMMLENNSKSPVYFGTGTMVYFDDADSVIDKIDVTLNKGGFSMDALEPLLKPGESSKFVTYGPNAAVKAKFIVKTVFGGGFKQIVSTSYTNELKQILGEETYRTVILKEAKELLQQSTETMKATLNTDYYKNKKYYELTKQFDDWEMIDFNVKSFNSNDKEYTAVLREYETTKGMAMDLLLKNLTGLLIPELYNTNDFRNFNFVIEGDKNDILVVKHHTLFNEYYRADILRLLDEKFNINKIFTGVKFSWDSDPIATALIKLN